MTAVASSTASVAIWRMSGGGETLLVLHNFSSSTVVAGNYTTVEQIISNGSVTTEGKKITLGPWSSVVYKI